MMRGQKLLILAILLNVIAFSQTSSLKELYYKKHARCDRTTCEKACNFINEKWVANCNHNCKNTIDNYEIPFEMQFKKCDELKEDDREACNKQNPLFYKSMKKKDIYCRVAFPAGA